MVHMSFGATCSSQILLRRGGIFYPISIFISFLSPQSINSYQTHVPISKMLPSFSSPHPANQTEPTRERNRTNSVSPAAPSRHAKFGQSKIAKYLTKSQILTNQTLPCVKICKTERIKYRHMSMIQSSNDKF